MRVAFVGLGKIGLPMALAAESRGHEVQGWDTSETVRSAIRERTMTYREEGAQVLLYKSKLRLAPVRDLVRWAELIFVAVQTPHRPEYEGITRLPDERADFDYSFLTAAVREIQAACGTHWPVLAVVSTVLPGTCERIVQGDAPFVYNPSFIAMGTTIADYLHPEFVLLGTDGHGSEVGDTMRAYYEKLHDRPLYWTNIATAELTKVAYNVFIGAKLAFVGALAEMADEVGANIDDVTDALSLATDRVISAKYLRAGMGDGGSCHPRDLIALSWLSDELGLGHDLFESFMLAREEHTAWIASLVAEQACRHHRGVVVLGKAYKPRSELTAGSPALLLTRMLTEEHGIHVTAYDPYVDEDAFLPAMPAVYVLATDHPQFATLKYPEGSIVIDPWGSVSEQPEVELIRPGRRTW